MVNNLGSNTKPWGTPQTTPWHLSVSLCLVTFNPVPCPTSNTIFVSFWGWYSVINCVIYDIFTTHDNRPFSCRPLTWSHLSTTFYGPDFKVCGVWFGFYQLCYGYWSMFCSVMAPIPDTGQPKILTCQHLIVRPYFVTLTLLENSNILDKIKTASNLIFKNIGQKHAFYPNLKDFRTI